MSGPNAPRSVQGILWLVGATFGAIVPALLASIMVPRMATTFADFGVELPWITQWVMTMHPILWSLPLATIMAGLAWPNASLRIRMAVIIGTASNVLGTLLVVFALYLPIFRLAETI